MRWGIDIKPKQRYYWYPYFAWWPVLLENKREKVWLEWVWRHTDRYEAAGIHVDVHRYRDDVWEGSRNLEMLEGE